jgi:hypothetical protein
MAEVTRPPFDPPYAGSRQEAADTTQSVDEVFTSLTAEDVRGIVRGELATAIAGALGALGSASALAAGPTVAYIEGEDGLRRRGRGKPKTGEKVVFLTDAEAIRKGLELSP